MDVGGLHRDKKFMEKSMEAIKARNEKLEPLAQKLQVSQDITLRTERRPLG